VAWGGERTAGDPQAREGGAEEGSGAEVGVVSVAQGKPRRLSGGPGGPVLPRRL